MTRSISARVQSVSIICAGVGWLLMSTAFMLVFLSKSVLDRKPQSERSRVLEVGGGGTRNAGRGGCRNDRTVGHVLDPDAHGPRGGIVGERGVALARSDLLRALVVHIVREPRAFEPPIDVCPQRGGAERHVVGITR